MLSEQIPDSACVLAYHKTFETEILNNIVGYFIDQDPSPILVVMPTVELAEAWSKDRLSPTIHDTPVLRSRVREPRSRDSGNTITHKRFPGGHISIVGANAGRRQLIQGHLGLRLLSDHGKPQV